MHYFQNGIAGFCGSSFSGVGIFFGPGGENRRERKVQGEEAGGRESKNIVSAKRGLIVKREVEVKI